MAAADDTTAADDTSDKLKIVALICLTSLVLAAIAGLTIVAVLTDRDLTNPEAFTFVMGIVIAVLGGLSVVGVRRHRRWRVEREDFNGIKGT